MRRISWLIATACGLIIMVFALLWQGIGSAKTVADWVRILSNSALLAGVMLAGIGALAWVSDEHFFDGIRYAVTSLFDNISGKPKRYATYYDFINRPKKRGGGFSLLVPGLVFLGLAVLLTGLYYVV